MRHCAATAASVLGLKVGASGLRRGELLTFPGHRLALVDTNVVPPAPASLSQLEVLQLGLFRPVLKLALPRFSFSICCDSVPRP